MSARFALPDERFSHVHMDIVIMCESEGFSYSLTMIDPYNSRWSKATRIVNKEAATVARTFVDTSGSLATAAW